MEYWPLLAIHFFKFYNIDLTFGLDSKSWKFLTRKAENILRNFQSLDSKLKVKSILQLFSSSHPVS
jgi:hypothetical protein